MVLGAPPLPKGKEPEPPTWAQLADMTALVPVAAAPPASRALRVGNAVFGRVPEPRRIFRNLRIWVGFALFGVVLHVPWLIVLAAGMGILTAVVNLIRWQRWRP